MTTQPSRSSAATIAAAGSFDDMTGIDAISEFLDAL